VDIEGHREILATEIGEIYDSILSESEKTELRKDGIQMVPERFFQYWTRKEAFAKALRLGLAFPFSAVSFLKIPDGTGLFVDISEQYAEFSGLWKSAEFRSHEYSFSISCRQSAEKPIVISVHLSEDLPFPYSQEFSEGAKMLFFKNTMSTFHP
jgi:phosphopantetheinyl transferase